MMEADCRSERKRKVQSPMLRFRKRTVPWAEGGRSYYLRSLSVPDQKQDHNENNYSLLNLGDLNEREKYATIAMNELNKRKEWFPTKLKGNYDLVDLGPIAYGHTSAGLLVLHFNFKARNVDATGSSIESFFIELIKTNRNVVTKVVLCRLGPTSSLPDKAETFGCLYCSSHNIHHPDVGGSRYLHNGREYYSKYLCLQNQKLYRFIRKSKEEGFIPTFSHPGVKYLHTNILCPSTEYATVALNLFKSETKGANFKLVNLCSFGKKRMAAGVLVHINFEAKNEDDPDAPIQTFFAEVYQCHFFIFALFCKCLGPSDLILPEEPQKYGCTLCVRDRVHHPPGSGYVNGREFLDLDED